MDKITYSFNVNSNSMSLNVYAQHMALIAHGLLGAVDIHWTQNIGDAGIAIVFEKAEHVALFATCWHSLTEEDWYRSLVRSGEGGQRTMLTPSSPRHECEILLSEHLYVREVTRIESDFKELGIPHAENGDYADAAVAALLGKVERLVSHLEVYDCEIEEQDSDTLAPRVRLKFSNSTDRSRFLREVERLGWCAPGSKD
jgi:hypothetical protein